VEQEHAMAGVSVEQEREAGVFSVQKEYTTARVEVKSNGCDGTRGIRRRRIGTRGS
jgi:hypothetical protein